MQCHSFSCFCFQYFFSQIDFYVIWNNHLRTKTADLVRPVTIHLAISGPLFNTPCFIADGGKFKSMIVGLPKTKHRFHTKFREHLSLFPIVAEGDATKSKLLHT
jgi:hypothetical protein